MPAGAFEGIDFSTQVERFRDSLDGPLDYPLFVSDIEEITNNPQVDGNRVFDHPEGRIAWTERYGFIFAVNNRIFFKEVIRRGLVPRADEPLGH